MSLTFSSQTSSFTLRADEIVLSIDATDDRIYMLTQLGASDPYTYWVSAFDHAGTPVSEIDGSTTKELTLDDPRAIALTNDEPAKVAISVYDNTSDWELYPLDFSTGGTLAGAEFFDFEIYFIIQGLARDVTVQSRFVCIFRRDDETTDTRVVIESDGGSHTDEGTWSTQQGRGKEIATTPTAAYVLTESNQIYKYDATYAFAETCDLPDGVTEAQGIASFGEEIILVSGTTIHTTAAGSVAPTVTPSERQLRLLNKHKSAINVDIVSGEIGEIPTNIRKTNIKVLLKTATEFERLFSVLDITNIYELFDNVVITPERTVSGVEVGDWIFLHIGDADVDPVLIPGGAYEIKGISLVGSLYRQQFICRRNTP